MSADNWRMCPRCEAERQADYAERRARLAKDYGKVPPDEYMTSHRLLETAIAKEENAVEETLREDYGLGLCGDGKFRISYSGSCEVCGLEHQFKHESAFGGWKPL